MTISVGFGLITCQHHPSDPAIRRAGGVADGVGPMVRKPARACGA